MTYSKPEVKTLGSALEVVLGESKESDIQFDNLKAVTTPAYQADE